MERAARLIKNQKISGDILNDTELARAIWPTAVGKSIAAHTGRLNLVRTTLVVEVEDAIWQKQLHTLSYQILARIRKLTSSNVIQDIEFRIAVPRRQPQRAESREGPQLSIGSTLDDEAERIQDPVLKKIYRLSRRKATG
jgi:hypothetical protein